MLLGELGSNRNFQPGGGGEIMENDAIPQRVDAEPLFDILGSVADSFEIIPGHVFQVVCIMSLLSQSIYHGKCLQHAAIVTMHRVGQYTYLHIFSVGMC